MSDAEKLRINKDLIAEMVAESPWTWRMLAKRLDVSKHAVDKFFREELNIRDTLAKTKKEFLKDGKIMCRECGSICIVGVDVDKPTDRKCPKCKQETKIIKKKKGWVDLTCQRNGCENNFRGASNHKYCSVSCRKRARQDYKNTRQRMINAGSWRGYMNSPIFGDTGEMLELETIAANESLRVHRNILTDRLAQIREAGLEPEEFIDYSDGLEPEELHEEIFNAILSRLTKLNKHKQHGKIKNDA